MLLAQIEKKSKIKITLSYDGLISKLLRKVKSLNCNKKRNILLRFRIIIFFLLDGWKTVLSPAPI